MMTGLTRRQFLAITGTAPLVRLSPQQATSPPNILFILADDLGYADLSCYGRRDYTTPNIDRLAQDGMRFTQAYANSAVCTATRVALITGRYQYRLPVGLEEPLTNSPRNIGLPPEHPTLPSLLKKAGYGTTLIGKWHMGWLPNYSPLKSGYDHFWGFRGGGLDYFTHKSAAANTNTDDLWDGGWRRVRHRRPLRGGDVGRNEKRQHRALQSAHQSLPPGGSSGRLCLSRLP